MSKPDAFTSMVQQADTGGHLWCIQSDRLVTNGRTQPTREQAVADFMSIGQYVCTRGPEGEAIETPVPATRDEAERAIDGTKTIPTENAA